MPLHIEPTGIPGVVLVTSKVMADERGFFREAFKRSSFRDLGIDVPVAQINHSRSARGTLRGLHFQRQPRAQGKLVQVVAGEIYDVAVDIRPESPTFLRWIGVRLTAADHRSIYVPPGCAHGFCAVSPDAEILYLATDEYAPDHEGGLRWNDPVLGIDWPVENPLVSMRDRHWPLLGDAATATSRLSAAETRPPFVEAASPSAAPGF